MEILSIEKKKFNVKMKLKGARRKGVLLLPHQNQENLFYI